MIKADKEGIKINGNPVEIADQFVEIAKGVREVFVDAFNENMASKALDAFYELSKFTDEELKSKPEEVIMKMVMNKVSEIE